MNICLQEKNLINYHRSYILLIICICFTLFITGCKNKEQLKPNSINPEFIGTWSNNDGCIMSLSKKNHSLILTAFHDKHQHNFTNVLLNLKKDGISTKFIAIDKQVRFSGMYIEGQMLIDNYCNQPLEKLDN